jgi:hypothetical protein
MTQIYFNVFQEIVLSTLLRHKICWIFACRFNQFICELDCGWAQPAISLTINQEKFRGSSDVFNMMILSTIQLLF